MPKIAEEARTARRDQIIAAAAECFARSGYHVTTMADIAEAAGVSKGTPYLYFPGKEALFIALYQEWDCGLAARVDAAVGRLGELARRSPRRVLAAVASAVAAHVLDNPQTCRVLMEATTLAAYEPVIAAKEWPPGTDPGLQARLFIAGLYGLMAQWHTAPGSFSLDAAMRALAGGGGEGPRERRGSSQGKGAGS